MHHIRLFYIYDHSLDTTKAFAARKSPSAFCFHNNTPNIQHSLSVTGLFWNQQTEGWEGKRRKSIGEIGSRGGRSLLRWHIEGQLVALNKQTTRKPGEWLLWLDTHSSMQCANAHVRACHKTEVSPTPADTPIKPSESKCPQSCDANRKSSVEEKCQTSSSDPADKNHMLYQLSHGPWEAIIHSRIPPTHTHTFTL